MKNNQLFDVLNNPEVFAVNQLPSRAHKETFGLDMISNEQVLNGQWKFKFIDNLSARSDYDPKEQYDNWDTIPVPSHIQLNGYGQIQYVNVCYPWDGVENVEAGCAPKNFNIGQYFKTFEINTTSNDCFISFEGVEQAFNLWINDKYVGYSEDSFTTSEFDISSFIIDGTNKIFVEVYQYTASSWLEDQDFWRFFGIFRDVKIKSIPKDHIFDFKITYDLSEDLKSVNVKVHTQQWKEETGYKLIVKKDEKVEKLIDIGEDKCFELEDVELWSAECPHLYELEFQTLNESFIHKIGFRDIKIEDKIIKLNNERIVFKGINRHEFSAISGRAITKEEIFADVKLIKEYNFNAIRTSHYPNNPYFYEVCDELGLYVIDEMNLETHGSWLDGNGNVNESTALPGDNKRLLNNLKFRADNMIDRDINYTSIIMWSLGNESYGGECLYKLSKHFKAKDNTRIIHYEGISWDRRYNDTSEVESQMYTRSEEIEEYFKNDYSKPFILCEYSHAMGNSNGNIDDYIALESKYPSYQGGFIWEFMDQALFIDGKFNYGGDFADRPTDYDFICDGLFGPNHEKKPDSEYIKKLFSPLQVETDQNNGIILRNTNTFKTLKVSIVNVVTKNKVKTILLPAQSEYVFSSEKAHYVFLNEFEEVLNEINTSIVPVTSYQALKCEGNYVDGQYHFGLNSEGFSILFSKSKNALVSIKYNNEELFDNVEAAFKPNFWRAPTSNDKGANKHIELSAWKLITDYSTPKISSYKYEENQLTVEIVYSCEYFPDYNSTVKYIVSEDGLIKIEFELDPHTTLPNPFCIGLSASINEKFKNYDFIGLGPIDSYCDRKSNLVRNRYYDNIQNNNGYFVPQEFANKTDVSQIKLSSDTTNLYIQSDKLFEFSYKQFHDQQLEKQTHRTNLSSDAPQLKLHTKSAGVGGDDSWMTWCKPEHEVHINQHSKLELILFGKGKYDR